MLTKIHPLIKQKSQNGASLIEYIAVMIIILGALYVMKDTIARGIFSKYKASGDSFAFGRQYDSKRTTVCKTDVLWFDENGTPMSTVTYDEDCYQTRVMKDPSQGGCNQCNPGWGSKACFDCEDRIKQSCQKDYCSDCASGEVPTLMGCKSAK